MMWQNRNIRKQRSWLSYRWKQKPEKTTTEPQRHRRNEFRSVRLCVSVVDFSYWEGQRGPIRRARSNQLTPTRRVPLAARINIGAAAGA